MISAAKLAVEISADTGAAERGLRGISGTIDSLAGKGTVLSQVFGGMLAASAITAAAAGFKQLAGEALTAYSNYEMLGQSMRSLAAREMMNAGAAGSMSQALEMAGGKAKELLNWTQKLAIESPYTQAGVAATYRQALAYGFTSEQAKRMTQAMIDYATATGQGEDAMQRAALALGQIQAKGKLAGQEVLQLVNAGIPVDTILARAFGRTTAEIVKMREEGVIPADKAIQAIIQSIEEDFSGAGKRAAGTFAGLLSTLKDIKEIGLREYFGAAFEQLQPKLQSLVDTFQKPETIEKLREWGKGLADVVTKVVADGEKLITWFTNLEKSSRDLVIGLGALILVGPNLISFFGGVSKAAVLALPGIIDFFAAWKAGLSLMTSLGAAGLSPLGVAFGTAGIAIATGTAVVYTYNETVKKANKEGVAEFTKGIQTLGKEFNTAEEAVKSFKSQMETIKTQTDPFKQSNVLGSMAAIAIDKRGMQAAALNELENHLLRTTKSGEEYHRMLMAATREMGIWTRLTEEYGITSIGALRGWTEAQYEAEMQAIRLKAAMDGLNTTYSFSGPLMEQANEAQKEVAVQANIAGAAFESQRRLMEQATTAAGNLAAAQERLKEAQQNWMQGAGGDVVQALKESGLSGKTFEEALAGIDSVYGTSYAIQNAYANDVKGLVAEYKKTGDIEAFKKKLGELKDTYMPLQDAVKKAKDEVEKLRLELAQIVSKDVYIRVFIEREYGYTYGNEGDLTGGGKFRTKAAGGKLSVGSPTLVGEEGPELILPQTPGLVVPADATRLILSMLQMFGGGMGRGGDVIFEAGAITVGSGSGVQAATLARELADEIRKRR